MNSRNSNNQKKIMLIAKVKLTGTKVADVEYATVEIINCLIYIFPKQPMGSPLVVWIQWWWFYQNNNQDFVSLSNYGLWSPARLPVGG